MEKTGFIYIWYDRKRKMFYIGSHWGNINDSYICSSNRMRDAYRRRPQDFKRRIVKTGIKREALLEEEHKWLQMIPESDLGKKYYNLRQHKWGHWSSDSDSRLTVGEKIREALTGKKFTEERRKNCGKSMLGKTHSEETKKKIGEATSKKLKGRKMSFEDRNKRKGKIPWNKGKTGYHSPETLEKISKSHKGKIPWNKGLKINEKKT